MSSHDNINKIKQTKKKKKGKIKTGLCNFSVLNYQRFFYINQLIFFLISESDYMVAFYQSIND